VFEEDFERAQRRQFVTKWIGQRIAVEADDEGNDLCRIEEEGGRELFEGRRDEDEGGS
jgi:hypothetical protein